MNKEAMRGYIYSVMADAFKEFAKDLHNQAEQDESPRNKEVLLRAGTACLNTSINLNVEARACIGKASNVTRGRKETLRDLREGRIAMSTKPRTRGLLTRLRESFQSTPREYDDVHLDLLNDEEPH